MTTATRTQAAALSAYTADADLRAAKLRLGDALPDTGWIRDYLTAVVPLTDAPVEFHLASAMCAISAALGNSVRVETWGQNVFPHLWAVLVAPSSFWRKSTSINTAEAILHAAVPSAALPSEFSREALLEALQERPTGLFAVKEFGGFLSMLGRDYMAGAKENLTELYDGPELFTRVLKKKVIEVRRPAITILGATTLDWLESKITDGDLRGGFLARFLFVTAKEKASGKGVTNGMPEPERNRLIAGLKAIADAALETPGGKAEYGPGTLELLNAWMAGWEAEVAGTHHRSDLSGFAVRLQTYALKLSMAYRASACLADSSASPAVIDEASMAAAIAYCRVLWANVSALIDNEMAITRESRELRRLRGIIGADGVTRSQALRLSHLRVREFEDYLRTLVESGEVRRERRTTADVGLDRARNREVEWLAPIHRNGHEEPLQYTDTVSTTVALAADEGDLQYTGTVSASEANRNGANHKLTVRPEPPFESPYSTQLTTTPRTEEDDDDEARGSTRARGANRKRRGRADHDSDAEALL